MRKLFLLLTSLSLLLLLAGCGGDNKKAEPTSAAPVAKEESLDSILQKFKAVKGWSYDMTTTINGKKMMDGSVWFAPDKLRMEFSVEGKKMITIQDGDFMYMYDPAEKTAMKFSKQSPLADQKTKIDKPDKFQQVPVPDWKVIETVTYDGVLCRVLEFTDASSGDKMKMWLRVDYGAPLRMELTPKSGNESIVQEYKNMKFDPIPADKFQLPSGVEVMSF